MPTYQSYPYTPWVFPDEAVMINRITKKKSVPNRVNVPADYMVGEKNDFYNYAVHEANARLQNNKIKELDMLQRRNTTAWTQRSQNEASRYYKKNGKFPGETTTSGGFLSGGTGLITRDGREWIQEVIKNRISQLNDIQSGSFKPAPEKIFIEPITNEVDTLLQQIIDSISVVSIPSSLIDTATKAVSALLRIGDKVRDSDLASIKQVITNIQENILGLLASPGTSPSAEKKAILKSVGKVLDRMEFVIKEIAKTSMESPDVRRATVKKIQGQLGKLVSQPYESIKPMQEATTAMQLGRETKAKLKASEFIKKLQKENPDGYTDYVMNIKDEKPFKVIRALISNNFGAEFAKEYTEGLHKLLVEEIKNPTEGEETPLKSIQKTTPSTPSLSSAAISTTPQTSTPQQQPGLMQQEETTQTNLQF